MTMGTAPTQADASPGSRAPVNPTGASLVHGPRTVLPIPQQAPNQGHHPSFTAGPLSRQGSDASPASRSPDSMSRQSSRGLRRVSFSDSELPSAASRPEALPSHASWQPTGFQPETEQTQRPTTLAQTRLPTASSFEGGPTPWALKNPHLPQQLPLASATHMLDTAPAAALRRASLAPSRAGTQASPGPSRRQSIESGRTSQTSQE